MAKLIVAATPIGNLGDLTENLRRALAECDLVAAEDTRVTLKLLNHLGIKKPMISCHRHNEDRRAAEIVARMLAEDLTVCLTSDAGTPAISDPGAAVVAAARAAGIPVTLSAGPSAITAALSVSGFTPGPFLFLGFLPRERAALHEALSGFDKAGVPVFVAYESPHRVVKLMEAVAEKFPEAKALAACDLTKKYERIDCGPVGAVLEALRANPSVEKGEYVIAVERPPCEAPEAAGAAEADAAALAILGAMLEGANLSEAADAALGRFPRNDVYRARLRVRDFLASQGE
jgi:16S rRNA (cytidine1402-2'-O)-methyltransferase